VTHVRVALIADIHGNTPALDAVLAEIEREDVDEIVCLGDVPVGPQPVETLERIESLGCHVVMGNWDAYFLDGFPVPAGELGRRLVEIGTWWAEKLTDGHRAFLRGFRPTLALDAGGRAELVAFHGSPRSFDDAILATTPAEELDVMLDGSSAAILAGGHTHFQLVRRHGPALVVNPGSVGLPFSSPAEVMHISPWAEFGLVAIEDGKLAVELRRTAYDLDAFLEIVRGSGMPYADWWAGLWNAEGAGSDPSSLQAVQSTMT
jgi:predicted phosphodiesterase